MKRLLAILILTIFHSLIVKGQEITLETMVSMQHGKVSLKQAINILSDQYEIQFSYSDSRIPVEDTVNLAFTNMALRDVLSSILYSKNLQFNIIGNQIVLYPTDQINRTVVKGKVIDLLSGEPVPYVHIILQGTNRGTSTNEEGMFSLPVPDMPSELLISHLAYEKQQVFIYDELIENDISLVPIKNTLQEITVSAKRNRQSAYHLLRKAYKQLAQSENAIRYGKAFYRQKSKREDRYTEIFELFYDVKYNSNGILDWAVQEGRYAFQTQDEFDIFLYNKNFTLLSRLFPIKQPNTDSYIIPINKEVKRLFELELADVIQQGERFLGIINYSPKGDLEAPAATGTLMIDLDTYEVLKMSGSISDKRLNIIGFGDTKSAWDNHQLDFEMVFIDGEKNSLELDYILINHQFDYFFNQQPVGRIQTSSMLSFYEHYKPVANKKLGGRINYRQSDMELIDRIGYDADFWAENSVVRRTPLEETLIEDFELNQAFGAVFLNNNDEVVLLPDQHDQEAAHRISTQFASRNKGNSTQRVFVALDKEQYGINDNIKFSAYVLDASSHKLSVIGSILELDIEDDNGNLILQKEFDLNEGVAYGEIDLSSIEHTGTLILKASTNVNKGELFSRQISVGQGLPLHVLKNDDANNRKDINVRFFPEGGTWLSGASSRIVFIAQDQYGSPLTGNWNLINEEGNTLKSTTTNVLGIGELVVEASSEQMLYLTVAGDDTDKIAIPGPKAKGVALAVEASKSKSLRIHMNQKPSLPSETYIVYAVGNKVFSIYQHKLTGGNEVIELPVSKLPSGVGTVHVLDHAGVILASRKVFIEPEELNIQLNTVQWASKRSNKLEMRLRVSDENGMPTDAHLSAKCTFAPRSSFMHRDIRNSVYFGDHEFLNQIDLSASKDSILTLIDQALIIDQEKSSSAELVSNQSPNYLARSASNSDTVEQEAIVAEVNVSSIYSPSRNENRRTKVRSKNVGISSDYWIPKLTFDPFGNTSIDYHVNKRSGIVYVTIQGVSASGLLGHKTFEIDLSKVKSRKEAKTRR